MQVLEKEAVGSFEPKNGFVYTLGVAPTRLINDVPYVYVFRQAAGHVKRPWGVRAERRREVKLIGGNYDPSKDIDWVDVIVREGREEGQVILYPRQISEAPYLSFITGQTRPEEEKLGEHRYILFLVLLQEEPPRIVVAERSTEAEHVEEANWVELDSVMNPVWRWKGARMNSAHRERLEALKHRYYELIYGKARAKKQSPKGKKIHREEVDWLKEA